MSKSLSPVLREIEVLLQHLVDTTTRLKEVDGVHVADTDVFTLALACTDDEIVIRTIDVRGHSGHGTRILSVIHAVAEEQSLSIRAHQVRSDASQFWIKCGYTPCDRDGSYIRS